MMYCEDDFWHPSNAFIGGLTGSIRIRLTSAGCMLVVKELNNDCAKVRCSKNHAPTALDRCGSLITCLIYGHLK